MNQPEDIWQSVWKPAIEDYQKDTRSTLKFDPADSADAEAVLDKIQKDFTRKRQQDWPKLRDAIKPVLFTAGKFSEAVGEGAGNV